MTAPVRSKCEVVDAAGSRGRAVSPHRGPRWPGYFSATDEVAGDL